jgi:hypothetical protein
MTDAIELNLERIRKALVRRRFTYSMSSNSGARKAQDDRRDVQVAKQPRVHGLSPDLAGRGFGSPSAKHDPVKDPVHREGTNARGLLKRVKALLLRLINR